MNSLNSYFFTLLFSLGFVETFQQILKTEIVQSAFDLFALFFFALVSRFCTRYIERKYRKFLVKLKNKNK